MKTRAWLVGLVVAAWSSAAIADPKQDAERLFTEAVALSTAGRHREACVKYEESQKLDPAAGTQFRLAECYASSGRYVDAIRLFSDLAKLMRVAGEPDKAKKAEDRANETRTRAPKLAVVMPWALGRTDVDVTIDGTPRRPSELKEPLVVDAGPRKIAVRVSAEERFAQQADAREGQTTTIDVPENVGRAKAPTPGAASASSLDARDELSHKRSALSWAGLGVAGAGVAALGVSTLIALGAKSDYDAAKDTCVPPSGCTQKAVDDAESARSTATTATIVGVGGGVAIAGGLALFFLAPPAKARSARIDISPALTARSASLTLTISPETF